MIVVSDTSPINYLVLIGEVSILHRLYARIVIPSAVFDELTHPYAPRPVRLWASTFPDWLEIMTPKEPLDCHALMPAKTPR